MKRAWVSAAARLALAAGFAAALALACALLWSRIGGEAEERAQGRELTAWLVDWDLDAGLRDYERMKGGVAGIQLFGAAFDEAGRLTFTDDFLAALSEAKAAAGPRAVPLHLTIVNDRLHADGGATQKDASLIGGLVADEGRRAQHIEHIVQAAKQYGFDGVEIDYENIEESQWEPLVLFYESLQLRLEAEGLPLRIVLEPKAPIERLALPSGPTYVLMAYNLHGGHSGPGPKADFAFVAEAARRLAHLPGEHVLAFSAGGFDWTDAEEGAAAVTEQEAVRLLERSPAPPVRDGASGSLRFRYADGAGAMHTVWYADEVTLVEWMRAAQREGVRRFALWRLGGLAASTADGLGAASGDASGPGTLGRK